MGGGVMIKFGCTLVICMVMAGYVAEAAVTCGTVVSSLAPCIPYATGGASSPSSGCCGGVRSLNNAAKSTPDRQTACKCLKQLAGSIHGVNYNVVGGLPGKCGVSIPYKISPSTNCNNVK